MYNNKYKLDAKCGTFRCVCGFPTLSCASSTFLDFCFFFFFLCFPQKLFSRSRVCFLLILALWNSKTAMNKYLVWLHFIFIRFLASAQLSLSFAELLNYVEIFNENFPVLQSCNSYVSTRYCDLLSALFVCLLCGSAFADAVVVIGVVVHKLYNKLLLIHWIFRSCERANQLIQKKSKGLYSIVVNLVPHGVWVILPLTEQQFM